MKKLLYSMASVFAAAFCILPVQLPAQAADTVSVAALPAGNINTVINGDTLADGTRANPNRVYRLRHGSVYQVTAPMKINGSITIIANDTVTGLRPPVLAPAILPDNSSIDHFFELNGKGAKAVIRDMYLLSIRADGVQLGWSAGIRITADSISLKLRGVVFDAFTESGIHQYASWSKLDIQDCHFRNFIHGSAYFGGQPIMAEFKNHMDTCKVINNTFFACNSYLWSIRGYDRYSVFEHNSIIYGVVNPFLTRQGRNLHIRNNLFYAAHAHGGIPDHVINGWFLNYPDTVSSSIINIRTSSTYNGLFAAGLEAHIDSAQGVTADMLTEENRTIDIRNNAYFYPTKLLNFYTAYNDTVTTKDSVDLPSGGRGYLTRKLTLPRWINDYTQKTIDSVLLVLAPATTAISNNINADPQFNTAIASHVDALIDYIRKIAAGAFDTTWHYKAVYPPAWPLPENLAYTSAALQNAGTDGFALGDLNWFPAQKNQWLTTGVEENSSSPVPEKFALFQNYPNPFNPTTTISFTLQISGMATLKVYDMIGREVAVLVNENLEAGYHKKTFNASNLPSGIYFARLQSNGKQMLQKMLLLK